MKVEWLKLLARKLRRTLAMHGLAVSHGQALDLIAAVPGLRNWSEATVFPDRVAACRFDDAAAKRIVRAVTARHELPVSIDRLMVSLWFMSSFHEGKAASSTGRLIVTTTYTGAGHLRQSRIADKVINLTDSLVWGPVPAATSAAAFFEARENAYDVDTGIGSELHEWERAEPAMDDWFEVVELCEAYQRVELWIDPTPNEQLLFIRLLSWLAREPRIVDKLFVVHAADSLGERGPDHPRTIASTALEVGPREMEAAARAWQAYCETTPEAFFGLLESDLDALPYLRRAVGLLLGELPAVATALGATERFLLDIISPGAVRPSRFFHANAQNNPSRVFSYFEEIRIIARMGGGRHLAIDGLRDAAFDFAAHQDAERRQRYMRSELSLTSFGRALLDGSADYAAHNPIHRWWGGTLLTNDRLWRWEAVNETLVAPR